MKEIPPIPTDTMFERYLKLRRDVETIRKRGKPVSPVLMRNLQNYDTWLSQRLEWWRINR